MRLSENAGTYGNAEEAIRKFFELDIVAKPLEYVNSIPELSQKDLDRIRNSLKKYMHLKMRLRP